MARSVGQAHRLHSRNILGTVYVDFDVLSNVLFRSGHNYIYISINSICLVTDVLKYVRLNVRIEGDWYSINSISLLLHIIVML